MPRPVGCRSLFNDTLRATERIEGNGLTYKLGDVDDLVRVLLSLRSAARRQELGQCGAEKMGNEFGWKEIAKRRIAEYQAAVAR